MFVIERLQNGLTDFYLSIFVCLADLAKQLLPSQLLVAEYILWPGFEHFLNTRLSVILLLFSTGIIFANFLSFEFGDKLKKDGDDFLFLKLKLSFWLIKNQTCIDKYTSSSTAHKLLSHFISVTIHTRKYHFELNSKKDKILIKKKNAMCIVSTNK